MISFQNIIFPSHMKLAWSFQQIISHLLGDAIGAVLVGMASPYLVPDVLSRLDWLDDWLADWRMDCLVNWMIVWLIDWLNGCLIEWFVDWMIGWLID